MKYLKALTALTAVWLAQLECFGQAVIWNGAGDGFSWTNGANWVGGQVPTSSKSAVVTNGTGTEVVISSAVSVVSVLCSKALVITNGSLEVTSEGSALSGAFTLTDGSYLTASGSGTMLTVSGPATIQGGSLYANNGGQLSLAGVTGYQAPTICEAITWQATGSNSVVSLPNLTNVIGNTNCAYLTIQALNGGQVLLSNVVSDLDGYASMQCDGEGSEINLSRMTKNAGSIDLEASAGGNVLLTELATSGVLNITLNAGGLISTTQMTNISGANLVVNAGADLVFPRVTSYEPPTECASISWQANGSNSVLDLSALTSVAGNTNCGYLTVQGLDGGHVLLGSATGVLGGSMAVQADGTNSEVYLSSLAENLGTLSFSAQTGGIIFSPKLGTSGVLSLTLGAGGTLSTAQYTNITGANLSVTGGAQLWFPAVVNYTSPTNCEGIIWQANGTSSVINMPALTNLAGNTVCGYLNVEAYNGGQILLSQVTAIHDGYQTFLASGAGAEISLSQMSGMVLESGQGSLTAEGGGTILFNDQAFLLSNVAINIGAGNPVLPPTLIPSQALTLYGTPWRAYVVEERNTLEPNSPVTTFFVTATNSFQAIAAAAPANTAFTIEEYVANPPVLQVGLANGQAQLLLFAETNANYQIQSATNLVNPIAWTSNNTATMTNEFRYFPTFQAKAAAEFFRAKKE